MGICAAATRSVGRSVARVVFISATHGREGRREEGGREASGVVVRICGMKRPGRQRRGDAEVPHAKTSHEQSTSVFSTKWSLVPRRQALPFRRSNFCKRRRSILNSGERAAAPSGCRSHRLLRLGGWEGVRSNADDSQGRIWISEETGTQK